MPIYRDSRFKPRIGCAARMLSLTYGHLAWAQPGNLVAFDSGQSLSQSAGRVPFGSYRTHHEVATLSQREEGSVTVELTDGRRLNSTSSFAPTDIAHWAGKTLFPESEAKYVGYYLWRGMLPESELVDTTPLEQTFVTPGYSGGHAVFGFVPSADGSTQLGRRSVNWAMYLQLEEAQLDDFFYRRSGQPSRRHDSPWNAPGDHRTIVAPARAATFAGILRRHYRPELPHIRSRDL